MVNSATRRKVFGKPELTESKPIVILIYSETNMADPSSRQVKEVTSKDGENSLKRKREPDQEGETPSIKKELDGLESPPAKIAAKSADISSSPKTTAERRPSSEMVKNTELSAPSTSENPSQKQETDGQGNDKDSGVEKMQYVLKFYSKFLE